MRQQIEYMMTVVDQERGSLGNLRRHVRRLFCDGRHFENVDLLVGRFGDGRSEGKMICCCAKGRRIRIPNECGGGRWS